MAKSVTRKASTDTRPAAVPHAFEKKELDLSHRRKLDPLSAVLEVTSGYFHRMRWSWLTFPYGGIEHPLEVDRFYPSKNIAIDIIGKNDDADMILYKTKLLNSHGIKYIRLLSEGDTQTLKAYVTVSNEL
jgi:hypothetical protein